MHPNQLIYDSAPILFFCVVSLSDTRRGLSHTETLKGPWTRTSKSCISVVKTIRRVGEERRGGVEVICYCVSSLHAVSNFVTSPDTVRSSKRSERSNARENHKRLLILEVVKWISVTKCFPSCELQINPKWFHYLNTRHENGCFTDYAMT